MSTFIKINGNCTLGDPGAVSRVGEKRRDESFQVREEDDSHRTISKNSSACRLLIGHKKCFALLCRIGEHRSWVLFVCFSYTTAIVSITACLGHAPKKCTKPGNFQFDIKSPSDFEILSDRKLKTLFQNTSFSLQQVFTLASATSGVNIFIECF